MGGLETAVSETTTRVFWESATFDATTIRLTAQRLGIRTDASTRYEKSLDPVLALKTFPRVLEYLRFLGKNVEIAGQFSLIRENLLNHIEISVPFALVKQKSGIEIPESDIQKILTKLGFQYQKTSDEFFSVIVPSWRATKDISIREDIVEEILRIYGYENIPKIPLSGDFSIQEKNKELSLYNRILQFFSARGWNEVYNYSFTNKDLEAKILSKNIDSLIAIQNAYTTDFTHMRDSLAPRLLENISTNLRHDATLRFFEIGKIYGKNLARDSRLNALLHDQKHLPFPEKMQFAGISTADTIATLRDTLERFFLEIFAKIPEISQGNDAHFLHPGVSGKYVHNGIVLAKFGKFHPQVVENFSIPENTLYFEVNFEEIFQIATQIVREFSHISAYQPISRELNFLLPKHTEIATVARKIEETHPWISSVVVDSIFEDAQKVGENMRSVNFAFVIQSPSSTISDDEAKNIQESVISAVESLGYKLRDF